MTRPVHNLRLRLSLNSILFLLIFLLVSSRSFGQSTQTYVGGYGEMSYKRFDDGELPRLDIDRFVIYLDHTFDPRWTFRSETEIENVKIEGGVGGEIGIEQAYLEYRASDWIGWRAGLVVLPIGIVNQAHEPTTFYSVSRPLFDQIVIPSTWREIGTGIYGDASKTLSYQLYLTEGLHTNAITMNGLDPAKQEGSAGAATSDTLAGSDASHPALSAKLNYDQVSGLLLGASGYLERGYTQELSRAFVLGDLDAEYAHGPWRLRAEGAFINTGDASDFDGVPTEIAGGYGEAAFNLLSLIEKSKWELFTFARYESYSFAQMTPVDPEFLSTTIAWTNHKAITGGFAYKPMNGLILKADYRWTSTDSPYERREFGLGAGYVF